MPDHPSNTIKLVDYQSHWSPSALQLAIECYGVERILFASDYPWIPRANARPYVERSASEADAAAILFDNQLPFIRIAEHDQGAMVIRNGVTGR